MSLASCCTRARHAPSIPVAGAPRSYRGGVENSGGGTAILIAIAAGLWMLYLVPMWRRRREFLATERNAVRLQQTLRIMAQTAEVPQEVHAEMTARAIAAQERSLAARQREEHAIARAHEAAAQRAMRLQLAGTAPGLIAEMDAARLGQRRLRRSRAATSLLTLGALAGVGASIAAAAWAWTALAGFIALSGMLLLRGLARASQRRTGQAAPRAASFVDYAPVAATERRSVQPTREWTPVPLPKPTYLAVPRAPEVPAAPAARAVPRPAVDHAAVLAAAAEEAERAQRTARPAAQQSAEQPAQRPAAELGDSRFARMGILDGLPTEAPDLDEVLQRRRAAG